MNYFSNITAAPEPEKLTAHQIEAIQRDIEKRAELKRQNYKFGAFNPHETFATRNSMSKEEIIRRNNSMTIHILKEFDEPIMANVIIKKADLNEASISSALVRMVKSGVIKKLRFNIKTISRNLYVMHDAPFDTAKFKEVSA
ncbi:MAG: hypothetical protein HRU29_01640 [Rhizobiales bacterium]|nr:hypothetical protein [Hyphomicrobiales bacterium]NRB13077.1 hypothetical protein [Hyphomicrobiales bacterium]